MSLLDMNAARVAIIILTMNQREKTLQCLSTLHAIASPPFNMLLWDNGSRDGTAETVKEAFPKVMVHYHPTNLGVASGRNEAAELAIETFKPTHLLFLDNDMIVEPGFVSALLEPFAKDPELGQTQAKLRIMHDQQRLDDAGRSKIDFLFGQTTPVGYGEIDRGQYDTRKKCVACGGATMVRTDVFQQLGGFDTKFDPFGPEDLDFSLRLSKIGYYALYVPQAVAYHDRSHTFGEGYSEEYARYKLIHWSLFMRRHASVMQKIGFAFLGAPFLALRIILREGRKGNVGALRGSVRGLIDFIKSSRSTSC